MSVYGISSRKVRVNGVLDEKLDPRQVVTFEELLRACLYEQEATRRVLVRKGLLTNEEVLSKSRRLNPASHSK